MSKRKYQIEETTLVVVQPSKKKSRVVKVRFILDCFIRFSFHQNTHMEFDLLFVAIYIVPDR